MTDSKEIELKKRELRLSFWTNTILVGILRDEKAGQYDEIVRRLRTSCTEHTKPSDPQPQPSCTSFMHLRELGWSSGHKTKFCIARGFDGVWNFPGSGYSSGGYCFRGPLSECAASIASSAVPK